MNTQEMTHLVQESFLKFFIALLSHYKGFMLDTRGSGINLLTASVSVILSLQTSF